MPIPQNNEQENRSRGEVGDLITRTEDEIRQQRGNAVAGQADYLVKNGSSLDRHYGQEMRLAGNENKGTGNEVTANWEGA